MEYNDYLGWIYPKSKDLVNTLDVQNIIDTQKEQPNGLATLDFSGKIPSEQLPAFVDDIIQYESIQSFPEEGEVGKIYVDLNSNLTYRWSGSQYIEISPSLAIGTSNTTAFRGDYGQIAYNHAVAAGSAYQQGLYKIGSNSQGHITSATAITKNDITNLGIPAQDTTYSLATTNENGLLSAIDKTKINSIENNAEVNQNTFSNVKVGTSTVSANTKTDTVELIAGNNIVLTPDITNKQVTIATTSSMYDSGTTAELQSGTATTDKVWPPQVIHDYVVSQLSNVDAMKFKGTLGVNGTITQLPTTGVHIGDTYRVITAGTYAGQTCSVGDLIIASSTTPTWTIAPTDTEGAVTGVSGTNPIQTTANGSNIAVSIIPASVTSAGSMSSADKIKLNGIAAGAEVNVQSDWNQNSSSSSDFIKNKPTSLAASSGGAAESLVTTGQKYIWNNKGTVTNVGITAGTGLSVSGSPITSSGSITIGHSNSITAGTIGGINYPSRAENSYAGITLKAPIFSYDAQGHITGASEETIPVLTTDDNLNAEKLYGTIPTSCLPAYVDDVLEYNARSGFPSTGETGKIYVDKTTNLTYRWSGTAYIEISPSLALGTTSSTAFRGDYGNTAYAHAVTNKGSAFESGLYKITTNSEGHVTQATAVVKADITALGIPSSDTNNKVTQAASITTNNNYPVLLGYSTATTSVTNTVNKNANFTFNPNTGNLQVTKINGIAVGNTPKFTDTTYTSEAAASGGTTESLVTTGEKYIWNNKQDKITNNITGTGSTGYIAKFNGTNTITTGPALGSSTTTFLRNDGTWTIPAGTYTLPKATNSILGGVKPWRYHTVGASGPTSAQNNNAVTVNNVTSTANRFYAIEADNNGRLFVNVPWEEGVELSQDTINKWEAILNPQLDQAAHAGGGNQD